MPDIEYLSKTIDRHAAAPQGKPCEACGTPVEPLDKFCPACGTPNPSFQPPAGTKPGPGIAAPGASEVPEVIDAQLVQPSPLSKYLKCQQCGAEVATD